MTPLSEPRLSVADLQVVLSGQEIVSGVGFDVPAGGFTALMGPNGCGKTTVLRAIYGALTPRAGSVRIDGADALGMRPAQRARKVAVLRQSPRMDFEFLVHEVVAIGRSPHKGLLEPDRAEDRAIVEEALQLTDAKHLWSRIFTTLSGGEKQRVLLARAIAQRPSLLLLDEPTNHLDLSHQIGILDCVRGLQITVLAALHDPNLALRFATDAVVLRSGRVHASGPIGEVLTPATLGEVFGVKVERLQRGDGSPVLAFG